MLGTPDRSQSFSFSCWLGENSVKVLFVQRRPHLILAQYMKTGPGEKCSWPDDRLLDSYTATPIHCPAPQPVYTFIHAQALLAP